jgi:hypothetical protein
VSSLAVGPLGVIARVTILRVIGHGSTGKITIVVARFALGTGIVGQGITVDGKGFIDAQGKRDPADVIRTPFQLGACVATRAAVCGVKGQIDAETIALEHRRRAIALTVGAFLVFVAGNPTGSAVR